MAIPGCGRRGARSRARMVLSNSVWVRRAVESLEERVLLSDSPWWVDCDCGVTSEPFAAHCWVQAGDIVLNETLSDANAHTPIRMV